MMSNTKSTEADAVDTDDDWSFSYESPADGDSALRDFLYGESDQVKEVLDHAYVRAKEDYDSILSGFTDIGPDNYTSEFTNPEKLSELPQLGQLVYRSRNQWHTARTAYQLPNGDVLETHSGGWKRWTRDANLVADHERRSVIKGHRYDAGLLDALVGLERLGVRALLHSWFGGPRVSMLSESVVRCFGGARSMRGDEKLERLHQYLAECAERHPQHSDSIAQARSLAIPGSIEHVVA